MNENTTIARRPRASAAEIMTNLGLEPDPWQLEVLDGTYQRLLLNCCRQAGKSTTVAMLAWVRRSNSAQRNKSWSFPISAGLSRCLVGKKRFAVTRISAFW